MRLLLQAIALLLCLNINAQKFNLYCSEIERVDTVYYNSKTIVIETNLEPQQAKEYYLLVLNTSNGMAETKVNQVKRRGGKTILYFRPKKKFLADYTNRDKYLILSKKSKE